MRRVRKWIVYIWLGGESGKKKASQNHEMGQGDRKMSGSIGKSYLQLG